jgi:hypothetical protein
MDGALKPFCILTTVLHHSWTQSGAIYGVMNKLPMSLNCKETKGKNRGK